MRHSPEEGFTQLEKLGAIREVSIFDRGQMVAELHRELQAEGHDTLVVAGTHAEISQLTEAIRQDRKNTANWELGILLIGTSHSSGRQPRNRNCPTTKRGWFCSSTGTQN
jgi:hypothetical protein